MRLQVVPGTGVKPTVQSCEMMRSFLLVGTDGCIQGGNQMNATILVLGFALLWGPLLAQDLTLATRGEPPACRIVRPAQASPSQLHAASELQRFTEQMTGVKLPIITDEVPLPESAILIGDTRHTAGSSAHRLISRPWVKMASGLVCRPPHLLMIGGPGARHALWRV
jgi:hypothetical protein